jgi:hypothetical protein
MADPGQMQLISSDGYGIEIQAIGYQFPEDPDERIRRSWLMIDGTANCAEGTWHFRWQALTPEEAVELSNWLRKAAAGEIPAPSAAGPHAAGHNGPYFTEPNLTLTLVGYQQQEAVLRIGLDLEFSPPWRKHNRAGDPFVIQCSRSAADLLKAANDWDTQIAPFPP